MLLRNYGMVTVELEIGHPDGRQEGEALLV